MALAPGLEGAGRLEQLYCAELASASRAARAIVHTEERAADVAHEAFAIALARIDEVLGFDRPGAWIRRVAINLALKERRRTAPCSLDQVGERASPAREGDVAVRLDLHALVRGLPARQRDAVLAFYFEDLPVAQVADRLGCSESTTRVHLHHARRSLARAIGEQGGPG